MKKNFTTVLFILFFLFAKTNVVCAQVNTQDSLALVDLYNSTDGSNWTDHTNWLTSAPLSTWYGVYISGTRVTTLILESNNLKGKLPASLGNLTKLTGLYLSTNLTIQDTIPASLGKLVNLEGLSLRDNMLSGKIPSELGNLTRLTTLDLSINNITGNIPAELGNLTKLSMLSLEGNKLNGRIPAFLGNLTNLTFLSLRKNKFTGNIPPQLGNLSNLSILFLSRNDLTGSIPVELGNLSSVQYLDLSADHLSESLPEELGNLSSLNILNLAGNQFTNNIPSSFGNLSQLESLILSNNQLSGTIPSSFANLKKLQDLFLSANQLSGSIPSFLGYLPVLFIIDINQNQFSDTIPASLIKDHFRINLAYNRFTFAGMGRLVSALGAYVTYSPQASIPLHKNGNILSVSAGSVLKNNTYKLYKDGILNQTKVGDSTFTITENGAYYIRVGNSVATKLKLYSDTINFSAGDNIIASQVNNKISYVSVYPNPAKTNTTISFYADGKYSISIADVSGKILQTKKGIAIKGANIIQLDVSKYASGIYLVTITDEKNNKQTVRLNKE